MGKTETTKTRLPLVHRWNLRVRSPRELYWKLHEFLESEHWEHEYKPLEPQHDAIDGSALFNSRLIGMHDSHPWWRILLGILACLTIILIPVGRCLFRSQRVAIIIEVEGESYRARGAKALSTQGKEVLDVVSDCRVILRLNAGKVVKSEKTNEETIKPTRNQKKIQELDRTITILKKKIDKEILPKIVLPKLQA